MFKSYQISLCYWSLEGKGESGRDEAEVSVALEKLF